MYRYAIIVTWLLCFSNEAMVPLKNLYEGRVRKATCADIAKDYPVLVSVQKGYRWVTVVSMNSINGTYWITVNNSNGSSPQNRSSKSPVYPLEKIFVPDKQHSASS